MDFFLLILVVSYMSLFIITLTVYFGVRNIFTQKIIFLNKVLSNENIKDYDLLKECKSFDFSVEGEKFPPPIIENNKENGSYVYVIEDFNEKKYKIIKFEIILSIIYLPIILIAVLLGFIF